jgi:hypothetical protein
VDYNPTQIGWRQKEYEELRMSGLSFSDSMEKMKIKRLCCREKFFNPPMTFLRIADIKIQDETGLLSKKDKIKGFSRVAKYVPGEPILPKRTLPEIPK